MAISEFFPKTGKLYVQSSDHYITIKDGLSLQIENLHSYLYFIATKCLWNIALVE